MDGHVFPKMEVGQLQIVLLYQELKIRFSGDSEGQEGERRH